MRSTRREREREKEEKERKRERESLRPSKLPNRYSWGKKVTYSLRTSVSIRLLPADGLDMVNVQSLQQRRPAMDVNQEEGETNQRCYCRAIHNSHSQHSTTAARRGEEREAWVPSAQLGCEFVSFFRSPDRPWVHVQNNTDLSSQLQHNSQHFSTKLDPPNTLAHLHKSPDQLYHSTMPLSCQQQTTATLVCNWEMLSLLSLLRLLLAATLCSRLSQFNNAFLPFSFLPSWLHPKLDMSGYIDFFSSTFSPLMIKVTFFTRFRNWFY